MSDYFYQTDFFVTFNQNISSILSDKADCLKSLFMLRIGLILHDYKTKNKKINKNFLNSLIFSLLDFKESF